MYMCVFTQIYQNDTNHLVFLSSLPTSMPISQWSGFPQGRERAHSSDGTFCFQSIVIFYLFGYSYSTSGRKGSGIAISGSSIELFLITYTILITGWSEVIFVLGEGSVWWHLVSQKHFIPSQVLWFPGERTVLGPGLACFACMCILIRSFLMMSGLFVSYFQAISWRRTHSGSWQRGQNGSRVPEPKPCFILYGNSIIPFKYWISMNFYKKTH